MTQDDLDGNSDGDTLTDEQHDWASRFVGLDTRRNANDAGSQSGTDPTTDGSGGGEPSESQPTAVEAAPPEGPSSASETQPNASQDLPDGSGLSGGSADPNVQPTGQGGIPFFINPDSFDFKPAGPNWQTTSCVEVVFGFGSPFLPMTRISVGVVVGAPLTLRDGQKLSVREAQLDSANAAEAAALIVKGMLDAGELVPAEVQPRFVGFMGGAIMSTGLGYRVTGCHPK